MLKLYGWGNVVPKEKGGLTATYSTKNVQNILLAEADVYFFRWDLFKVLKNIFL